MQSQTFCLLISIVVGALLLPPSANAKCNTCSGSGIACNGLNTFNLCYDGVVDHSLSFNCPTGQVCIADGGIVCSADALPDCSMAHRACGVCNGSKMFTCITRTTFAQCNGETVLQRATANCPPGMVCDSTSPEICVADDSVAAAECEE